MSNLDRSTEIIQMAGALRLDTSNPVENIVRFCVEKVSRWCDEEGGIVSIQDIERIVCKRLKLVFEEFSDIEGLKAIIGKYLALGEPVFVTLMDDFDASTFATTIERRKVNGHSPDRYVAIVDCRGEKAHRRFFTRWHEIAHLLTAYQQLELPLHRSTTKKDPPEQLMDIIAGAVGFFDPLILPLIEEEIRVNQYLKFSGIEQIRGNFCPHASFQSTLNACAARANIPIIVVEARFALKKKEQRLLDDGLPLGVPKPEPKVRAVNVSPNASARGKIEIHRNMEVPATSIIARALRQEGDFAFMSDGWSVEDMGDWMHSDGHGLRSIRVRVEVRRFGDSVLALIQPHLAM